MEVMPIMQMLMDVRSATRIKVLSIFVRMVSPIPLSPQQVHPDASAVMSRMKRATSLSGQ
jgi:hypothetical protein